MMQYYNRRNYYHLKFFWNKVYYKPTNQQSNKQTKKTRETVNKTHHLKVNNGFKIEYLQIF